MRTRRAIAAHNLKTTRSGKVKRRSILWRLRRWLFLAGLLVRHRRRRRRLRAVDGRAAGAAPARSTRPRSSATSSVPAGQCNAANAMAAFHGSEDRVDVTLDQVPQVMQDAVLAAEDRDFFEHGGVDPVGIARAAWADIREQGRRSRAARRSPSST